MTFGDTLNPDWLIVDSAETTQTIARANPDVGVVFAREQLKGRGRFQRSWFSPAGKSISMTLALDLGSPHAKPWLLGMAIATAAAECLQVQLQWPNDLVAEGRKVGGILTEVEGARCFVGIGINVGQESFPPEISDSAASLFLLGRVEEPLPLARKLVDFLSVRPIPAAWADIQLYWEARDQTPGKIYKLSDGSVATAVEVGSEGELVVEQAGVRKEIFAAEAIFGPTTSMSSTLAVQK